MEFKISRREDRYSTQVGCRFRGIDGRMNQCVQEIHGHEVDPNAIEYAKRNLERQANEMLQQQAIQQSRMLEQRINPPMATADYEPVFYRPGTRYVAIAASTDASDSLFYTNATDTSATLTQAHLEDAYRHLTVYGNATIGIDPAYGVSPTFIDTRATIDGLEIEVEVPVGKRSITVKTTIKNGKIQITEHDIVKATQALIEQKRFTIITNRAERRAEDLLRSMISDIDFRSYKEKGFFIVKSGNRVFRIYKDKSKWIDMWEQDHIRRDFAPKNRLCTHTQTRDLPDADEALSKLLLIRSGSVIQHSNLHSAKDGYGHYIGEPMNRLKEKELILV